MREALTLVAEVPLERLEAISQGALCPDETAFHIERTLRLPGKWLDGLNKEVPQRTLELLKNPDRAELHDDEDVEETSPALPPEVSPASAQRRVGGRSRSPADTRCGAGGRSWAPCSEGGCCGYNRRGALFPCGNELRRGQDSAKSSKPGQWRRPDSC